MHPYFMPGYGPYGHMPFGYGPGRGLVVLIVVAVILFAVTHRRRTCRRDDGPAPRPLDEKLADMERRAAALETLLDRQPHGDK